MSDDSHEYDEDALEFIEDERVRIAALHATCPKEIWLQVDPEAEQFDGWDAQTWCSDKINETDVRYVLAASRDAEVVSLTNQRDYEYVRAENAEQENDQLRAQINGLREAMGLLEKYVSYNGDTWVQKEARNALATTPEQSLAEYRNKVIEAFVNEFSRHVGGDGEFWLHELQDFAMKEQP